MHKFITMLKTELKLSIRGMDMVIFALCMPVAVTLILGCMYGSKPAFEGAEYTFLEQSFGAMSSILYFPMLIFSGATLPYEVMPEALQRAVNLMPLTQGIKLLKAASLGLPIESVGISVIIMIACAVICGGIAVRFFRWE